MISCSVLISIGLSAQIPTTGLLGHWSFTGNANDATSNANTATVYGATLGNDRFSNASSAYYFDGVNDYITIPNISSYQDNTLSVCFWFKVTADMQVTGGSLDNVMGLMNKSSSTTNLNQRQFDFNIRQQSGSVSPPFDPYFQTSNATNTSNTNVSATDQIVENKWYFIVGIIDQPNAKQSLYLNGVLIGNSTSATNPYLNTSMITLGRFLDLNNNRYLNGAIDDIRIYDYPLTECDILNLYLEGYDISNLFPVGVGRTANPNITAIGNGFTETSFETENTLVIKTKVKDKEVTRTNIMKIYPNPAQDRVFFNYGNTDLLSGYKLKIVDSFGNSVYESTIKSATESIDVKSIGGAGTFFIQLISPENTMEIRKLVIVN